MRFAFFVFLSLLFLTSCKTYEQYGGLRWNDAFQPIDAKYPVDVFASGLSVDSALLVIKLLGSEKTRNANWLDSLPFSFKVFTDTTGGDKFFFNDSTSLSIPTKTVGTKSNDVITRAFSLRNNIKWIRVDIQSKGLSYRRMVEIPTASALPPLVIDSGNALVNPSSLHAFATYHFVKSIATSTKVLHYPFPRNPASPAYRNNDLSSTHLLPDTTYALTSANGFRFDETGVYRFNDTLAKQDFSVTINDPNFPSIRSPRELVRPLRYITKNEEYNKMLTAENPKVAVDSFWLVKSKADVIARKSIRVFYNRVEEANRLFTTYLAGWMTDRGMMLIMYGPPDRAFKFKEGEIWTYTKNFPRTLEFVFVRRESFLGFDYELRRSDEYTSSWNQQSFKWRTGGILNDVQDIF